MAPAPKILETWGGVRPVTALDDRDVLLVASAMLHRLGTVLERGIGTATIEDRDHELESRCFIVAGWLRGYLSRLG